MYAVQKDNPENRIQMTEEEYLAFDEASEENYEYVRGEVYAMSGGSVKHSVLAAQMIIHLGNLLDGKGCTVASSDAKVHIASKESYRHPDVTVFCGRPEYVEGRTDTLKNPVVLVEVLSPSSSLRDYNEKLAEYIEIESLQAYLLVTQDEIKVESYQRHETGQWLYQAVTSIDGEIHMPALDCTLLLEKIYANIDWDETEA